MPLETAVEERYAAAARRPEDALGCPVDYDPRFLEIIPQEVIERDYGCGDPSPVTLVGLTLVDGLQWVFAWIVTLPVAALLAYCVVRYVA